VDAVILVHLWTKFLPELEKCDLQGSCNEEINTSEVLDMVCALC
jgi:hypothetical protein